MRFISILIMSQYQIKHSQFLIQVGYNQSLRTYFASVLDRKQNQILLQIGIDYDQIRDISELQSCLKNYTAIPYSMHIKLQDDAAADGLEPNFVHKLVEHYFS